MISQIPEFHNSWGHRSYFITVKPRFSSTQTCSCANPRKNNYLNSPLPECFNNEIMLDSAETTARLYFGAYLVKSAEVQVPVWFLCARANGNEGGKTPSHKAELREVFMSEWEITSNSDQSAKQPTKNYLQLSGLLLRSVKLKNYLKYHYFHFTLQILNAIPIFLNEIFIWLEGNLYENQRDGLNYKEIVLEKSFFITKHWSSSNFLNGCIVQFNCHSTF